jgi:hypothetical protein
MKFIKYFPKTGDVELDIFIKYIDEENIARRKEKLKNDPNYMAMKNKEEWWDIVFNEDLLNNELNKLDELKESFKSLNNDPAILPDMALAGIHHLNGKTSIIWSSDEVKMKFQNQLDNYINNLSSLYNI